MYGLKDKRFSANVSNLELKLESVTATNALMKEDLSIAQNSLVKLQEENKQLLVQLQRLTTDSSSQACKEGASSSGRKQMPRIVAKASKREVRTLKSASVRCPCHRHLTRLLLLDGAQ